MIEACTVPASNDPGAAAFNDLLSEAASAYPGEAFVVSLNDVICPGGACVPVLDDVLLQYDGHHFTGSASRMLVPILFERIAATGAMASDA